MIPYSRTMIVLRRPLHSVVSDRNSLGIFVPLPPAVLMGIPNEANIELEAGLVKFCFSVLWYCVKNGKHSTGNIIRPKPASNEMIASWVYPIKTDGGNGTKKQKTCPSETAQYRAHLSTIIIIHE